MKIYIIVSDYPETKTTPLLWSYAYKSYDKAEKAVLHILGENKFEVSVDHIYDTTAYIEASGIRVIYIREVEVVGGAA